MRILMAIAGAAKGGAEKHFERLVRAFHAHDGVTVEVFMRHNYERYKRLFDLGIPLRQAPFGGFFDFKTKRMFADHITEFKPDVVFTWLNRATKFCPKTDALHVGRPGGYYDLKYYRKCDLMIAMTEHLRTFYLDKGWPSEKIVTIPNFADEPITGTPLPSLLSLDPKKKMVLALGRFHPNKGFDVLLRAMMNVPQAQLCLLGEGDEKQNLLALAAPIANRVHILPWQENITPFMEHADVFVCPSRHEPFGSVILEAWSHKKPLIASESEGPSQVIDHEKTGLLVPVGNDDALSSAISRILEDEKLAKDLAKNGHDTYKKRYHESVVVQHYLDTFASFRLAPQKARDVS
ncbi:MAG: glycosyltransferase [bacterium]|jgi:glycosyltransferase involved in cell wall biosynthesis